MADKSGNTGVRLTWLGQAGFLIEGGGFRLVIDPYLSDSLYEKYKDKKFPHSRMVEAPFSPEELTALNYVLCTHGHTDHMDPGTLPGLAAANPGCGFICPQAEREKAIERGVPVQMLAGMNTGGRFFDCNDGCRDDGIGITALASAHEELAVDEQGQSLYLGYVIEIGGQTLYHSGDCVPYDGLAEQLESLEVDIALLPVNGRDEARRSNGVPGNFTLREAVELCDAAGIRILIPHHFGMFAFNTEDPEKIEMVLSESNLGYKIPVIGNTMEL